MTEAMPFLQKLITFLWPPDIPSGENGRGVFRSEGESALQTLSRRRKCRRPGRSG